MVEPADNEPLAATRAFFGPRAANWEERFPDDEPAYSAAIEALEIPVGGVVLDAACGTGRALPLLRRCVGQTGTVVGVDVTPEMLGAAVSAGRHAAVAGLVLGDVTCLPVVDAVFDAVFGAGLLPHLPDVDEGMAELARVTAPGGRLGLFHPIGRAALAARHGREPDPNDVRAEPAVRRLLGRTGWRTDFVDDGAERYFVMATRMSL